MSDKLSKKLSRVISDYYWNELEEFSEGYGDIETLNKLNLHFNIKLNWDKLIDIFRENGYCL